MDKEELNSFTAADILNAIYLISRKKEFRAIYTTTQAFNPYRLASPLTIISTGF